MNRKDGNEKKESLWDMAVRMSHEQATQPEKNDQQERTVLFLGSSSVVSFENAKQLRRVEFLSPRVVNFISFQHSGDNPNNSILFQLKLDSSDYYRNEVNATMRLRSCCFSSRQMKSYCMTSCRELEVYESLLHI